MEAFPPMGSFLLCKLKIPQPIGIKSVLSI
jgi:hypothetical protein